MGLGARMAELRIARGESLQHVADAVGVSKAHIWDLEKGRADNPSMALVTRIAAHLGVPLGYLIGEEAEGSHSDPTIERMFRQAGELHPDDRAILDDMMQAMLRRRRQERA